MTICISSRTFFLSSLIAFQAGSSFVCVRACHLDARHKAGVVMLDEIDP